MTKTISILTEAAQVVEGPRQAAYGSPADNFNRIARLWTAHLANIGVQAELGASDVAAMMRLMKEARLANSPNHRDSLVDLAGYAACQAQIEGID